MTASLASQKMIAYHSFCLTIYCLAVDSHLGDDCIESFASDLLLVEGIFANVMSRYEML
jgi:hypothetical protein